MKLDELRKLPNIAEELSEHELRSIAQNVIEGYQADDASRADWKQLHKDALDLAKQTVEEKTTPWKGAANVKFPLITKASIDFAARTYPELVRSNRVVSANIVGEDPKGFKTLKARNVTTYMSNLLLNQMDGWEEGLDSLLHVLSICGTVFNKVYWDKLKKQPVVELCNSDKIIVNHNVKSLRDARRITHILDVYKNDIIQQIRLGNYRDIELAKLSPNVDEVGDSDPQYTLIEQHTYLDLDDDGYSEPYVVIVHKESSEVLSIRPRFKEIIKENDKVVHIEPDLVFVDYHFIRNPDGGFYSLGFGCLLYPINASINTVINQLLDSGTLNNQQSGFIGRGIRIKNGDVKLKMGEWKVIDSIAGTDIKNNIVPLPTKEPSQVLFSLLNLLIQAGKELTSASEVTNGQAPPSNVPAAAYLNSVEQSLKILNAIHKRVYKSLGRQFKNIFVLLSKNLKDSEYRAVIDNPHITVKDDFDFKSYDICPVADPTMSTSEQRLARMQAIMSVPVKNQDIATKLYLRTLEIDDTTIEALMTPPENAQPAPEAMKIMAEIELIKAQVAKITQDSATQMQKLLQDKQQLELNAAQVEALVNESAARIIQIQEDIKNNHTKTQITQGKTEHTSVLKELALLQKKVKDMEDGEFREKELIAHTTVEMAKIEEKADSTSKKVVADLVKANKDDKSTNNSDND